MFSAARLQVTAALRGARTLPPRLSYSTYRAPSSIEGKAFTILGAGTLGRRIALMWLTQGRRVNLFDSNRAALDAAKGYIDETLPSVIHDLVHDGKPGTLALFSDRSQALDNSWMVTEAVPEILDLKINLLGELDGILDDDVILATNSSSYTPSETGTKVKNQSRLVATHYYMPPMSIPVEIMPTAQTDPSIAPLLLKEAARHGLKPFHVRKESVGLMANRIWAAIKRECLFVAAEGIAKPNEIDELLQLALGMPRGPFQSMDQVGLDVVNDIENHYAQVRPQHCPPEVREYLSSYLKAGKLGVKTGEGFYKHPKETPHAKDHLVFLDLVKGEVQSMTVDGQENKTLVSGLKNMPDGVQIDGRTGLVYWTAMGTSGSSNDGSIWRAKLDGSEVTAIVKPGETHTPKQIVLDGETLYWCDREGGRIQSCQLDGSQLTTLYDSATNEARPLQDGQNWCVGIALDTKRQLLYWTQKGGSKGWAGRIFRAPIPQAGQKITEVETLFHNLPEPIDLEIDAESQQLYWTDRGDPPYGNTLNKASVAKAFSAESSPAGPSADLMLAERFHETIGLALDTEKRLAYVSDLLGSIWSVNLDTGDKRALIRDRGNYSGITLHKFTNSTP